MTNRDTICYVIARSRWVRLSSFLFGGSGSWCGAGARSGCSGGGCSVIVGASGWWAAASVARVVGAREGDKDGFVTKFVLDVGTASLHVAESGSVLVVDSFVFAIFAVVGVVEAVAPAILAIVVGFVGDVFFVGIMGGTVSCIAASVVATAFLVSAVEVGFEVG